MADILVRNVDNVYARVETDGGLLRELWDVFSFHPPNYRYMKKYKNGVWDGYIRLLNIWSQKIYIGLIPYIEEFAKENDYSFEYQQPIEPDISPEKSDKYLDSLNVHSNGKKITPHDYQYTGLHHILTKKRVTLLSPTASGKSLIIYGAIRALLDTDGIKKILIVVPTTTLNHQLKGDFSDYSSANGWDVENNVHLIYSGQDKTSEKPVIISTWQSIFKQDENYFSQYDAIIVDEAHSVKATSLTGILEKCQVEYRIGLTATLDDAEAHRLTIEGLLGKAITLATTKQLMDRGEIAKLKINSILFQYPDSDRMIKRKYQDEFTFLITLEKRNNAMINLAGKLKENTLLLFLRIEHGNYLYEKIKEKYQDRNVYFVDGSVKANDRDKIRAIMEKENDAIVVASYGTFAVGINIKKIMHIILGSPSKAKIELLQSIGRGLRTHKDKKKLTLWDIADDLTWKKRQNYTLLHFLVRLKIYINQEFNYQMKKIKI